MTQNTQSTPPAGAALNADWMLRIQAALSSGQKPEYDDLEAGVCALLAQAKAHRREAAGAEAAFSFIEHECRLVKIEDGVVTIRLELDCELFTREGARGAIAVLQAAKRDAARAAQAELVCTNTTEGSIECQKR